MQDLVRYAHRARALEVTAELGYSHLDVLSKSMLEISARAISSNGAVRCSELRMYQIDTQGWALASQPVPPAASSETTPQTVCLLPPSLPRTNRPTAREHERQALSTHGAAYDILHISKDLDNPRNLVPARRPMAPTTTPSFFKKTLKQGTFVS